MYLRVNRRRCGKISAFCWRPRPARRGAGAEGAGLLLAKLTHSESHDPLPSPTLLAEVAWPDRPIGAAGSKALAFRHVTAPRPKHSTVTTSANLSDLPIGRQSPIGAVRRFRCYQPESPRKTFVERAPILAESYAQCVALEALNSLCPVELSRHEGVSTASGQPLSDAKRSARAIRTISAGAHRVARILLFLTRKPTEPSVR